MSGAARLHPFAFRLARDGVSEAFTFYATDQAAARRMAEAWAAPRRWTVVEDLPGKRPDGAIPAPVGAKR